MTPSLPPSGVRLPQTHPPDKMAQCVRFLKLGWRPETISKEIFIPVYVRYATVRVICFDMARRFPLEVGLLGDLVS
jgi:hypothetical protein